MKNKIFIISGPSGVGKKTIIDNFVHDPELNLAYSISMTTREPRKTEVNNKDYYFVSHEEFEKAIQNNEMVEWAVFSNNKYGTRKSELDRILNDKKNVLLEIEVQGAVQVFQNLDHQEYVSIFIAPPSLEELKNRLINRGTETNKEIENRICIAEKELSAQKFYDHVVINDNIENAVKEVKKIIKEACE